VGLNRIDSVCDKVLRRISGLSKEEVTGRVRKLQNRGFINFLTSENINRVIKPRNMR
jgi:hypothetical protein